jgi:hypothetical protein
MTDKELRLLLGDYGVEQPEQFLDGMHKENKAALKDFFNNRQQIQGLLDKQPSNAYGYDPVGAPIENLGMNPNNQPMGLQNYQGAPNTGLPISLLGGGNTHVGGGINGSMFGGRMGAEINLSPEQQLALGVSGGGTKMTYGVGTPYQGQANRSDITGLDATYRDFARNQEFGAAFQKDPKMNPFLSMFYRKQF